MDWTLAVLSVVTFVVVGYLWVRKQYRFFEEKGIPYVLPKFPLGNLWGVGTKVHYGIYIGEVYSRFKKLTEKEMFAGIFYFTKPVVITTNLDMLRNMLVKDFQYFQDRGIYVNEKDDPLSGHIFFLPGHKSKRLRNKLTPTFTTGKMKMMHWTIVAVALEFQKYFESFADKKAEIEVRDILARFTTDVIGSCAFGIECNSLKDPDTEFRKMGKKAFQFTDLEFLRFCFLGMFPNLGRALRMKTTKDDVSKFFTGVLRETIDYREKNNVKRNDFLSLMIQIKNTGKLDDDGVDLGTITFDELAAQTFLFFIAGFETSSSTMTFALYELARDKEIQDRARAEVHSVLEKYNQEYTYEACMELKYVDQVIKETLRMHPIIPTLARNLTQDYKIPDREVVFKKGTSFNVPIFGIHRDPEIYPDPDKFDPDRFTEENIKNRHPYSWLPFGEGPRNCIGIRFGMMQMRIGLATLLSKYKIAVTSRTPIPMVYSVGSAILAPENGLWLKIERI